MKNKIIILSFFMFIIFASCKDNSPVQQTEPAQIMNLNTNNFWISNNIYYDSLGNKKITFSDTLSFYKDTIINNEKWYISNGGQWYINRSDGLWLGTVTVQNLIAKYPAEIGDSWASMNNSVVMLIAKGEQVTVSAGTFSCYVYEMTSHNESDPNFIWYYRYTFWVCPGIGTVKGEGLSRTNYGRYYISYTEELTEYSIL